MKLNALLVFIPVAIALHWYGASAIVVFATSALALIPLAGLTEDATDALASYVGPTWGGLLSASLGNAPEIIIGFFALRQGLVKVVKSSLAGSIIGNLLFGLGLSMFAGGLKHGTQSFNRQVAGMNAGLLMLAAAGLIIPAVFHHSSAAVARDQPGDLGRPLRCLPGEPGLHPGDQPPSPGQGGRPAQVETCPEPPGGEAGWSRNKAIGILTVVTIGLAIMSEILTDAIEPASESLGLTPVFAGVFLLALIGNIAQIFNAVSFARSDKMDLSLGVTVGSSIQVALVVAPVLVFSGELMGQPMDLLFSRFEMVAVGLSVLVTRQLIQDGQSNWLEGLMLVAVYLMLGVGFYNLPARAAG